MYLGSETDRQLIYGTLRTRLGLKQSLLWLSLALSLIWISSELENRFYVPAGLFATIVGFVIVIFPSLIATLFIAGLIADHASRSVANTLARSLDDARRQAEHVDSVLRSIEVSLASCAGQTADLAGAAGDEGFGLIASATRLTEAASEVQQAGRAADAAASRLAGMISELHGLGGQIDGFDARLHGGTLPNVRAIEALLASVQVRGDEVSAQADVAITSMIKQLAEVDEQSRQMTTRIAKRAYALDTAVDGASGRAVALLDAVGERVGEQMAVLDERLASARANLSGVGAQGAEVTGQHLDRLLAAAGDLSRLLSLCDEQSQKLHDTADRKLVALPARLNEAQLQGEAVFTALAAHAAALAAGLDQLEMPFATSTTAIESIGARMNDLQRIADNFGHMLATSLPAATVQFNELGSGATALTRQVDGLRETLAAGEQATRQVGILVGEARVELAALGDADLRLVNDHVNATALGIRNLGHQIAAQAALSGETKAIVESDLEALDERLRALQNESEACLTAVSAHVSEVRASIDGLTDPFADVGHLLDDVLVQVTTVTEATAAIELRLDHRIAATTTSFAELDARAEGLVAQTSALRAATAEEAQLIAVASDIFARERVAFTAAAAALGAKFEHARTVLDELDTATARISAGTAEQLGQTFERVRVMAEASSVALGGMLERIIGDAQLALDKAGATTAEAAFGIPIRREVLAVEAAADRAGAMAEAAAQRVAGQAQAMTVKIDEVDAKVDEIETRLDVRARDTLSARSTRLIEMLNAASVDVARLLSIDADEQAWVRYSRGDRSIFARRMVRLIDRPTTAKIKRHFAHDEAFHHEASHYLDLFEQLSRRLLADPDGDALLATVVSSDIGKLYVAIARATGRWSPTA